MKFKIDENLPVEVADVVRGAGYDASTVSEERLSGRKDPAIAAICRQEARTLVTLDTDFADIRTYPPAQYSGLVVLRLRRQDKPSVLRIVTRLMTSFAIEPLDGHLWIVEDHRLRIRG